MGEMNHVIDPALPAEAFREGGFARRIRHLVEKEGRRMVPEWAADCREMLW